MDKIGSLRDQKSYEETTIKLRLKNTIKALFPPKFYNQ